MQPLILIVDDDPMVVNLHAALLQDYRQREAYSGAEALRAAACEPQPDLILLDICMPDQSGLDVLDSLKASQALRHIPVILVTGRADAATEARGFALGAVDFIAKPIKAPLLRARVGTHIALKQARDRLRLQNAGLEQEVMRRTEETTRFQGVTIRALAQLAEVRDADTGGHLQRTQGYVKLLVSLLRGHADYATQLNEQKAIRVIQAAPLHDIGKVGIPDAVLLKKSRLTEDEWQTMKTHAALGGDAIAAVAAELDEPDPLLEVAHAMTRWHHERWDGSGYPDGLAGTRIPLEARIMAMADVFDALISPRVYKPAFSFDEARDEILAMRGGAFEPDMCDLFAANYEHFVAIAEQNMSARQSASS